MTPSPGSVTPPRGPCYRPFRAASPRASPGVAGAGGAIPGDLPLDSERKLRVAGLVGRVGGTGRADGRTRGCEDQHAGSE
jgi:hypothetical protein